MTHASIHDGVMTLEDGTQIQGVTVELIAAAPKLYKALKEIITFVLPDETDEAWLLMWDIAQEALAEAKGESLYPE